MVENQQRLNDQKRQQIVAFKHQTHYFPISVQRQIINE
jgi:hypothetical protein